MIPDMNVLKAARWEKTYIHIPASRGCDFCKFKARHAVYCMDDDSVYYLCHSHFDAMGRGVVA